jgi:hypothetical protein
LEWLFPLFWLAVMARLEVTTPGISVSEIHLSPGCNHVGREGENDILLPHPSVSRKHCELWLTEEAVLVRDLQSRNGTHIDGTPVDEAELRTGQTLRIGDIELVLAEAPVRISVPELTYGARPKEQLYLPDGTPACYRHDEVAAKYECGKCRHCYCGECVRELRVAGGIPRRFCPDCGGPCEHIAHGPQEQKRASWMDKIVRAFTKPPSRRP